MRGSRDLVHIDADREHQAPGRRFARKDQAAFEREFRKYRRSVLAMLHADFPRLSDLEDLCQEAWTELLELEAKRGSAIENREGMLKRIAWRRARDTIRKLKPYPADPSSLVLRRAVDDDVATEEQVQLKLDAAGIRSIIKLLDERSVIALKLRFDAGLPAGEIAARLGVTRKRLDKIFEAAYGLIQRQLDLDAAGERNWSRRQRSMLLACETGLASDETRRFAQSMVDSDPYCRAMLGQMREALRDVAAALPIPVLAEEERTERLLTLLLDRADGLRLDVRQWLEQIAHRGGSSGASEGLTLGGAGIGAGAITKAALACLAAGGTIAACIGELPRSGDERRVPSAAAAPPSRAVVEPDRSVVRPVLVPVVVKKPKPPATPRKREEPVSSPKAAPTPSPAPAGSTEFGPGAVGSQPAVRTPAAAPVNGGGEFLP